MSFHEAPVHLTIGLVICASLLLLRFVRLFGQPPLIGDMLAGLLVGIGLNHVSATLDESNRSLAINIAASLEHLGTIGLVFVVVNALFYAPRNDISGHSTSNAKAVFIVTLTNCIPSLLIGAWLAIQYAASHDIAATPSFLILIGVSMSISAVPVLAGILKELNLQQREQQKM